MGVRGIEEVENQRENERFFLLLQNVSSYVSETFPFCICNTHRVCVWYHLRFGYCMP